MCQGKRDCDGPGCAPTEPIAVPDETTEEIPPFWCFDRSVAWSLVRTAVVLLALAWQWIGKSPRP